MSVNAWNEILTGGIEDVFRVGENGVKGRILIFDTRNSIMKYVDVLNHSDSKTSSLPPLRCSL